MFYSKMEGNKGLWDKNIHLLEIRAHRALFVLYGEGKISP